MNKAEINDEIVVLRQTVRLARTSFILKAIREAKRLRNNHGSEKQVEKNKTKADKLLKEVNALKRIKDDDITKYGISCIEELEDGPQISSLDDAARAMIKVIRHKSLSTGLLDLREKFPNYKEYISLSKKGKKKGTIVTRLEKSVEKTPKVGTRQSPRTKKNVLKDETRVENLKKDENVSSRTRGSSMKQSEKEKVKVKDTELSSSIEKSGAPKQGKKEGGYSPDSSTTRSVEEPMPLKEVPKVVSAEATVKRFTEILNDTSAERATAPSSSGLESQKFGAPRIMDDFFLSEHQDERSNDDLGPLGFRNGGEQHRGAPETRSEKRTIWDDETSVCQGGAQNENRGRSRNEYENRSRNEFENRSRNDYQNRSRNEYQNRSRSEYQNRSRNEYQNRNENRLNEFTGGINSRRWNREIESERGNGCTNIESAKVETSEQKSASLHPSWVARRKQQEIAKSGFQGKKIVFTDD